MTPLHLSLILQLEPLFLETNDPSPLSLVLRLESLFLETNDPSPPFPGSQFELLFHETNDPSLSLPGSQLELLFLETKEPPPPPFPSRNEEALRTSLGLNVFPVMSQKYSPTCTCNTGINDMQLCHEKVHSPSSFTQKHLTGDK